MEKIRFFDIAGVVFACCLAAVSCDDKGKDEPQSDNPAVYITDKAKIETIRSLKDLDGTGRIYEMHYTADYKLDEVLEAGPVTTTDLQAFVFQTLFDKMPSKSVDMGYGAGCSAFAVREAGSGDFLMGRNFDYRHRNPATGEGDLPISAIVLHTSPKGGKKSVSIADSYWLGYFQGFYNDGKTDISALVGAPYVIMDGINEDGFAIGILALDGTPAQQNYPDRKHRTSTSTTMRMLLDRVSTVDQAIKMLNEYNVNMAMASKGSYHFFMADATGDYATVEYVCPKGSDIPSEMDVIRGADTCRYVTNFYLSPAMAETPHGSKYSQHGRARYDTLAVRLAGYGYRPTANQAMKLLGEVSQSSVEGTPTSHTQWSSLYNLSDRSLRLAILQEYAKEFKFKVK